MVKPIDPIKREWMKELRLDKGLVVREIAGIFGISAQHYSDIENGRRNPSIALSLSLSKFFDVPVELFLEDRTKFNK
jgi:transcriptional regulator with XRE-family HTH domain